MSFYEDASLIVLADGAYDSGIKAFKPVLNDSDPSDPNYLVPSGVGDLTVDRNSTATRINADGLIEEVGVNIPRLDYSDGSCPVWLCEPTTTNLITYSEDFSNAAWGKSSSGTGVAPVVTANQGLSPDGSVNADRITFQAPLSTDRSSITDTIIVSNGVDYNGSFYIKAWSASDVGKVLLFRHVGSIAYTQVTLTSDWQRIELTETSISTSISFNIESRPNLGSSLGTIDCLLWGAQLEQKSYPTSYVKTTGATATRGADAITGAGDSTTFNSQEGVLFFEGRAIADDLSYRVISLSDGGSSDRVVLGYNNSNNTIYTFMDSSSVPQGSISYSAIDITDYLKVAVLYRENDIKFYVNGLLVGVDTSATMPTGLNELAFDSGAGGSPFYGRVKRLLVYDSALTDSELESLTGFGSFAEMASYLSYS